MTVEDIFPEGMSEEDRLAKAKQFLSEAAMKLRRKMPEFEKLLDELPVHAPVTIEDEKTWMMIRWLMAHFLAREAEAEHDRVTEEAGFDFTGVDGAPYLPDSGGD
jgi:hypothetical protein